MKLDTKYEIGYKVWNWIQNMKLDTKYEIWYKIWNWIQNMKLGTKYEIGYKIRNWWHMYDKRKTKWSLLYVMHWYGTVGEGLLVEIVMRSETWVNKYEPNSKSKSMRWRQTMAVVILHAYKIWNWIQNIKLDTKYEIGYKIWNSIQNTKLGTKYEIGYSMLNWV